MPEFLFGLALQDMNLRFAVHEPVVVATSFYESCEFIDANHNGVVGGVK